MAWYIGGRAVTPMYGFCLAGAGLMSEPDDFRLERLSNRDGMCAGRFSDIAHVSYPSQVPNMLGCLRLRTWH